MFTGLVEELGTVVSASSNELWLRGPATLADTNLGDSICVNGCCLTVAALGGNSAPGTWRADIMDSTLAATTLGQLRPGDNVNLERAATLQTRLGGHIVQGHVDGVGQVESFTNGGVLQVRIPQGLERFVVPRGSITLNGVSLTAVTVEGTLVTVSLIPETLARTNLGTLTVGDAVNIEVDILAKYVAKLLPGNEGTVR